MAWLSLHIDIKVLTVAMACISGLALYICWYRACSVAQGWQIATLMAIYPRRWSRTLILIHCDALLDRCQRWYIPATLGLCIRHHSSHLGRWYGESSLVVGHGVVARCLCVSNIQRTLMLSDSVRVSYVAHQSVSTLSSQRMRLPAQLICPHHRWYLMHAPAICSRLWEIFWEGVRRLVFDSSAMILWLSIVR